MLNLKPILEQELKNKIYNVFGSHNRFYFENIFYQCEKDFTRNRKYKKVPWEKLNNAYVFIHDYKNVVPINKNPDNIDTNICLACVEFNGHAFYIIFYIDINNELRVFIPKDNGFNPKTKMPGGINVYEDVEYYLSQRKQDSRTYEYEALAIRNFENHVKEYPPFYKPFSDSVSISKCFNNFRINSSMCNIKSNVTKKTFNGVKRKTFKLIREERAYEHVREERPINSSNLYAYTESPQIRWSTRGAFTFSERTS